MKWMLLNHGKVNFAKSLDLRLFQFDYVLNNMIPADVPIPEFEIPTSAFQLRYSRQGIRGRIFDRRH